LGRRGKPGKPRLHGILKPELFRLPDCEEASSFDRCLDYEKFLKAAVELFNAVAELREQHRRKTLDIWNSYLALTVILSANGLRIREAIRAAARFYETGERKFAITAEKGGDARIVKIPEFIERGDVEYVYRETVKHGEERVKERIEQWFLGVFGVNPHAVRYAYVRYHVLRGRSTGEIARALGIKKERNIKDYYLRGLHLEEEAEEDGGAG
jgi:hypothetical protein